MVAEGKKTTLLKHKHTMNTEVKKEKKSVWKRALYAATTIALASSLYACSTVGAFYVGRVSGALRAKERVVSVLSEEEQKIRSNRVLREDARDLLADGIEMSGEVVKKLSLGDLLSENREVEKRSIRKQERERKPGVWRDGEEQDAYLGTRPGLEEDVQAETAYWQRQ
ncbi:hypothetical protein D6783_04785 [Candidatus Woesearchaeota archaeon]|nr:MAG: hypothetical protein D6783_04785 [Candidatus Woesearchaeota archaeon]